MVTNSRLAAFTVWLAVLTVVPGISFGEVTLSAIQANPGSLFQKVTCYKGGATTTGKESTLSGVVNTGELKTSPAVIGRTAAEYTVFGVYKYLVDDNGSVADYKKIQDALDAAKDGQTIYVCPGTYREQIRISNDVKLLSVAGADETVIDASTVDEGTVVTIAASATVQGFTITGAHHDLTCFHGGGIYVSGTLTDEDVVETNTPVIQQNKIIGNDACTGGDGVEVAGASRSGGNTVYNRATIRNNVISGEGGMAVAIQCENAPDSVIQNNVITNGTGIWLEEDTECAGISIIGNAIYDTSTPIVTFTISNNTATSVYDPQATIEYNDIYDFTSTAFSVSALSSTNLNVDPVFVDTTDYRLDAASPLVDAGDPSSSYNDTDGSRNDIGAYGGKQGGW
jgi:hypothetical protein